MKQNNKLVSVVVPVFNSERTISRIIKSVLSQPYSNIELIIIDDGSRDDTLKIVRSFQQDKRVKIISQKNQGVSAARNTGLKISSGEYIMFFDSDDDVSPHMISKMLATALSHPKHLIVCGFKYNGKKLLPGYSGLAQGDIKKHVLKSILRGGNLYSPCNKIYSAGIIKKQSLSFPKGILFGEDLIFNLNYLKFSKSIFYINKPYYIYEKSSSSSSALSAKNSSDRRAMYDSLLAYIGKQKSLQNLSLLTLIRLRWFVSVKKAKIFQWGRKK